MKIIQYCQHVLGVGHLFRSLEISRALSAHEVILVTGGPPVETDLPEHVREFRLPDLQMDQAFKGLFSTAKDLTIEQIKEERQKQLLALFEREKPDLFLVELYPFGRKAFRFELDPVLKALREKRLGPCRVISSVRDILVEKDDHGKHEARVVKTLNRYFDGVLVHGDPDLVEIRETFAPFSEIEIPVEYTGYIACRPSVDAARRIRKKMMIGDDEMVIVASAGGGNVGAPLLKSVIHAFNQLERENCRLQVFTGPFLDSQDFDDLQKMATEKAQVDRFTADFTSYLAAADLSVSMGGYNTTMNILATRVPALLWPFSQNREQRLRAERLADRGLLTVLKDEDLQPDRLAAMMDQKLTQPTRPDVAIDLDGAANTARAIEAFYGQTFFHHENTKAGKHEI
jgi:predicted glycosyltransferase